MVGICYRCWSRPANRTAHAADEAAEVARSYLAAVGANRQGRAVGRRRVEHVITVSGLEKRYRDGTYAVRGVDFNVRRGEIFGLLGPNGAGKTTTMTILGTLHNATAGTATVLGHDVRTQAAAIRKQIGFAMQEVGMDDLATAWEMMMFHASLYGIDKAEARKRSERLLREFGLWQHKDRRCTRFSGGMQRRLDLAVSLLHRPKVLFLDEPTTGLDPTSRTDLWRLLRRLRDEEGITIVMSTHYMDEADALCDRIAVMHAGRIAALDTPTALKRSVGADRIHVSLNRAPQDSEVAALRRAFGSHLQVHDDALTIVVRDGRHALLPAMRELDKAGIAVAGTRVQSPRLDDVFLQYTGQQLEAD